VKQEVLDSQELMVLLVYLANRVLLVQQDLLGLLVHRGQKARQALKERREIKDHLACRVEESLDYQSLDQQDQQEFQVGQEEQGQQVQMVKQVQQE